MKNGILGIILGAHKLWLKGDPRGSRADLSGANLIGADLSDADLRDADLSDADLRYADLRRADLRYAILRYAILRRAVLLDADLSDAILRRAVLLDADLSDADLRRADLLDADLRRADLRYVVGNGGAEMTCLQDRWPVVITKDVIAIGCQQHPVQDWWDFSDEQIAEMDQKALEWWRTRKPILKALYEAKFRN